jgi:restriction system protein
MECLLLFIGFFALCIWPSLREWYWKTKEPIENRKWLEEYQRGEAAWESKQVKFISGVVAKHIDTLVVKRHNMVHKNDYGVEDLTPLRKEVECFVENVLNPEHSKWVDSLDWSEQMKLSDDVKEHKSKWKKEMVGVVCRFIEDTYSKPENKRRIEEAFKQDEEVPDNPHEYERFVARILKKDSWRSRATQGSGDQGADVVAEKDGFKVIIQCKMWKKPVGNKAVQEVISAMKFFDGTHGLVVSSNGQFTNSARELAAKSGIELLHHNELNGWTPD